MKDNEYNFEDLLGRKMAIEVIYNFLDKYDCTKENQSGEDQMKGTKFARDKSIVVLVDTRQH